MGKDKNWAGRNLCVTLKNVFEKTIASRFHGDSYYYYHLYFLQVIQYENTMIDDLSSYNTTKWTPKELHHWNKLLRH